MAGQLVSYLLTHDLFPLCQSGFRVGHSTETAVLCVLSDLLQAADGGECGVLVLLDLSPAFDTVDHAILLERLEPSFGLSGSVLNWYRSYLLDRTQYVRCGSSRSVAILDSSAAFQKVRCSARFFPSPRLLI